MILKCKRSHRFLCDIDIESYVKNLKDKYPLKPITDIVIDSEASHFDNRLITDGIQHSLSKKGSGSVDDGVQHLQSLMDKELFYILDKPSIRFILNDGRYEEDIVDRSGIEFDSYQYDRIKSANTGINCYKKELDHSIDATRYIIREFVDSGRCPIV